MDGISVSPWLFPSYRQPKPKQKKDVENINVAWSTTKLSDLELSLTGGDDNWCDKHPDWAGDCKSYVAFCATVPTSPSMYGDVDAGLCWTDCKTYIDFLKTIPSHFQGDASEWCAKTEQDREDWLAAPENNLPANYPCHSLDDWRNFIIFVEEYNKANPNAQLPSDFAKWHEWDILSNDTRKALVAAYNKYMDVWIDYNDVGVNKPICDDKVDDIDSYTKCLLSPASYPCQDCESWHNFQEYTDISLYYQMWNTAKNEDKIEALRKYYDFQQTTKGKICTDCSPCNDYFTSEFPCADCKDTYEYLNWTDTTYGASIKWLTYEQLTDAEKRQCWYSWNKFREEKATTCKTQANLPDKLYPDNFPHPECWYAYVDFCRTNTTNQAQINNLDQFPELWVHYNAQTDDKKRELWQSVYYFSLTNKAGCGDCHKLPTELMPREFPCKNDCSEWYKYTKWCFDNNKFTNDDNWQNYANLDNTKRRALYDTWNKEYIKDTSIDHACTECEPIPTSVVPICKSFELMGWGYDDWNTYQRNCGDISVYENMDILVTELQTEIKNIQTNGDATFTPTSGRFPTFFTYVPYFYQVVYTDMTGKTAQEGCNALYSAYLANPDINISKLMNADTQYENAYNIGVQYGCPAMLINRPCTDKYPEPEVWTYYSEAGYAYFNGIKNTACTKKGGCETTWCEYVSWVNENIGNTFNGSKVDSYWISRWYSWDLMNTYPEICGQYAASNCGDSSLYNGTLCAAKDKATNEWYTCRGCGQHRDSCITFKNEYCTALGTYCEGMPDSFRLAWGINDDGTYPKKTDTATNKEITIYEAWCQIKNDTTKTTAFNSLNDQITSCTNLLAAFDENVKTEADRYWEDNWTMSDGSPIVATNKDSDDVYSLWAANFDNVCYNCNRTTDDGSLASKTIMLYNTQSNMPWSWRLYFGRSTNDWYKFLVYQVSSIGVPSFHTLDTLASECQGYLEAIVGVGNSDIEYRAVEKSDYDDFTDPAWWTKFLYIGSTVTGTSTNECNCSATGQSGAYLAIDLLDPTKVSLKNILIWCLFDYTGITETEKLRRHGNFWAEVILQATARSTGGFKLAGATLSSNYSALCGVSSLGGNINGSTKTPSPATQLRAAQAYVSTVAKSYYAANIDSLSECIWSPYKFGYSALIDTTSLTPTTAMNCTTT
jgi:hypothetical protein